MCSCISSIFKLLVYVDADFPRTDFQHLALSYKMPLEVRNSSAFEFRLNETPAFFSFPLCCLIARMQLLPMQFTFLSVAAAETGLSMDLRQFESYFKLGLLKSLEFHRSAGNI